MRTTAVVLAILIAGVLAGPVRAQGRELSPEQQRQLQELEQKIQAAFAAGDYAAAEQACRAQIAIVPDHPVFHYNLACALSRQDKVTEGIQALRKSVELGFHDVNKISTDPDLENLKKDKGFADVIALANQKQEEALAGVYEPGKPIEGVRTVEDAPEGGLRYRLHLPTDASAQNPARLIVWLGMKMEEPFGSMNDVVEPLAPRFAEKGFALLVLTEKQWQRWPDVERTRLTDVTIPAAVKRPEIDSGKKPVLLGFGGGGQLALDLWTEGAGRYGGIVVNAAYPVDKQVYEQERRVVPRKLSDDPALKTVPVLAIIGDRDPISQVWFVPEIAWKKEGVPLTIDWVVGKGREYLLEGRLDAVLEWLGKLER
jgi:hypothetical protein